METLRSIFMELLHISLISSLLFMVIAFIRIVFGKRLWAKSVYFLWIVFLLRLLFPFHIESPISFENHFEQAFDSFSSNRQVVNNNSVNEDLITYGSLNKEIYEYPTTQTNILNIMIYIWLFGIFAVMFFPIISYSTLKKALDDDELALGSRMDSLVFDARMKLNIEKLTIRYSYYLDAPALIGVFNPVIILPYHLAQEDDQVVYQILLHEMMHYKKQHLLLQWLFWFAKAIYWFNPLLWLAHEWMKLDAELACDDEVIKVIGEEERMAYGHNLINISESSVNSPYLIHAAGLLTKSSELKKRIIRISEKKVKPRSLSFLTILISILILPVFFTVKANDIDYQTWGFTTSYKGDIKANEIYSLRPRNCSYDSQSGDFLVTLDFELSETFKTLKADNVYLRLDFDLTFPKSYDPTIRNNPVSTSIDIEDIYTRDSITLTFNIKDFDLEAFSSPVLVFAGNELSILQKPAIFTLNTDSIPYTHKIDDYVTLKFSRFENINGPNVAIEYEYESHFNSLTGNSNEYLDLNINYELYDSEANYIDYHGMSGSLDEDSAELILSFDNIVDIDYADITIEGYSIHSNQTYFASGHSSYDRDTDLKWPLPIAKDMITKEDE